MPTPDMSSPGGANQDWLNQFLTWLGNSGQGAGPAAPPNPNAPAPNSQTPYQVAGPMMGLSAGYDQAARLQRYLVSPASVVNVPNAQNAPASVPITDQAGNSISPNSAPPVANTPPPQPPYNVLSGGSANTGLPYGVGAPPQPPYNVLGGGSANTGLPPGVSAPGPDDASIIARQKMRARGATTTAAPVPNLGYYAPTTGVAGRGTWTPYAANDPRIYRGPLSMYGRG